MYRGAGMEIPIPIYNIIRTCGLVVTTLFEFGTRILVSGI